MTVNKDRSGHSEEQGAGRHRLVLTDRVNMEIFGVNNVDTFDDKEIVISTTMGGLTLIGTGLHISRLDVEAKEMCVNGQIDCLLYREDAGGRKSLLRGKNPVGRILK